MTLPPRATFAAALTTMMMLAGAATFARPPISGAHSAIVLGAHASALSAVHPSVALVPVTPPKLEKSETNLTAGAKRACVAAGQIVGATVLGDRTIEVELSSGERYHMEFADDCPFVGFYEGFYYKRTQAGMLCAGRDSVIGRSGLQCAIQHFHRHLDPRP